MTDDLKGEGAPPGYRRLYLFDEFDRFISAAYGLELAEYIRIIDTVMTEEDAQLFFDLTMEERYEEGRELLTKHFSGL
jgi:hypothetical protein